MEPIFFDPAYKDYIWGGTALKERFGKETSLPIVAESWEISANKNGKSVVRNGEYCGRDLDELFKDADVKEKIFGTKSLNMSEFPVLIKFIDAKNNLSVQVHPDDEYARKYENSSGKSELWYIVDCKENARIVYGLKDTEQPITSIVDNIEEHLNFVNVKKGDYVYIESGTVHAILDGILICEIQQNSDITYRIFDWNRLGKDGKPRELHKDKAKDVIKIYNRNELKHIKEIEGSQNMINNDKFSIDSVNIENTYQDQSNIETFYAYNVIEGNGKLITDNETYNIKRGESFIIPADLGKYEIKGRMKLLKTYM